jgi:hypothetical protein
MTPPCYDCGEHDGRTLAGGIRCNDCEESRVNGWAQYGAATIGIETASRNERSMV